MKIIIAEIAGKDSISAINKFINETNIEYSVIPSIVYTGTEYGRVESYKESIEYLKTIVRDNISIAETQELHNENLWNVLNFKYQYLINKKYNFFTPCIMCHFYTHLLRVPLYIENNSVGLITGERLSHNGKIKINQHSMVLNCFREIFGKYKINIVQPVLDITETIDVDEIIRNENIRNKANDVKCILSNNLYGFSLENSKSIDLLKFYLTDFVLPIGVLCVDSMIKHKSIDITKLENKIREILYE